MAPKKYHGVIVPLITPVDDSGNIDHGSVKKLINHVTEANTFPFILGTTGECQSMNSAKQLELVAAVSKYVNKKKTLYTGISNNSLQNSIESAKQFFDLGADVFVAHLPSYYPLDDIHILNYYESLADSIPAPVMIYNIPVTTHISIPIKMIKKLADHPKICGLKDSERSLERINAIGAAFSDRADFSILSGWTNQSAEALMKGFDGIVPSTANMIPGVFQQLYISVLDGDFDKAKEWQQKIDPLADLHQKDKKVFEVIPMLKIMLNSRGLCEKFLLPPLLPMDEIEESRFRMELSRIDI